MYYDEITVENWLLLTFVGLATDASFTCFFGSIICSHHKHERGEEQGYK